MPNGLLGTEVKVGIEMKIIIMTILEVGVEIETIADMSQGEDTRSQSNSRVSTYCNRVRCYRCQEYDHFASECPNTPTDKETDYEDIDPPSLQMMTQNYGPVDSEGEVEYLNL